MVTHTIIIHSEYSPPPKKSWKRKDVEKRDNMVIYKTTIEKKWI